MPFTGHLSQQLLVDPTFKDGANEWDVKDKGVEEPNTYRKGYFSVFEPGESLNERGLLIEGMQHGSLMQKLPYSPGKYYATVRYFLPESVSGWTGAWLIEILDAQGKVIQIPSNKAPSRLLELTAGQQHLVSIPFTLPSGIEQAKSMRVVLFLNGMKPTSRLYLSEMALYRAG